MRRQRLQDVDEVAPLAGRQSGGGLVEEDEARCAGQRQGDLQLALLAMAQLGDRLLTHRLQMDGGQQRHGGFNERTLARRPEPGRAEEACTPAGEYASGDPISDNETVRRSEESRD